MIFGKHINRYYLKYGWMLLLGLAALVAVDYLQLIIPNLYQMTVNGINDGKVTNAQKQTIGFARGVRVDWIACYYFFRLFDK